LIFLFPFYLIILKVNTNFDNIKMVLGTELRVEFKLFKIKEEKESNIIEVVNIEKCNRKETRKKNIKKVEKLDFSFNFIIEEMNKMLNEGNKQKELFCQSVSESLYEDLVNGILKNYTSTIKGCRENIKYYPKSSIEMYDFCNDYIHVLNVIYLDGRYKKYCDIGTLFNIICIPDLDKEEVEEYTNIEDYDRTIICDKKKTKKDEMIKNLSSSLLNLMNNDELFNRIVLIESKSILEKKQTNLRRIGYNINSVERGLINNSYYSFLDTESSSNKEISDSKIYEIKKTILELMDKKNEVNKKLNERVIDILHPEIIKIINNNSKNINKYLENIDNQKLGLTFDNQKLGTTFDDYYDNVFGELCKGITDSLKEKKSTLLNVVKDNHITKKYVYELSKIKDDIETLNTELNLKKKQTNESDDKIIENNKKIKMEKEEITKKLNNELIELEKQKEELEKCIKIYDSTVSILTSKINKDMDNIKNWGKILDEIIDKRGINKYGKNSHSIPNLLMTDDIFSMINANDNTITNDPNNINNNININDKSEVKNEDKKIDEERKAALILRESDTDEIKKLIDEINNLNKNLNTKVKKRLSMKNEVTLKKLDDSINQIYAEFEIKFNKIADLRKQIKMDEI